MEKVEKMPPERTDADVHKQSFLVSFQLNYTGMVIPGAIYYK